MLEKFYPASSWAHILEKILVCLDPQDIDNCLRVNQTWKLIVNECLFKSPIHGVRAELRWRWFTNEIKVETLLNCEFKQKPKEVILEGKNIFVRTEDSLMSFCLDTRQLLAEANGFPSGGYLFVPVGGSVILVETLRPTNERPDPDFCILVFNRSDLILTKEQILVNEVHDCYRRRFLDDKIVYDQDGDSLVYICNDGEMIKLRRSDFAPKRTKSIKMEGSQFLRYDIGEEKGEVTLTLMKIVDSAIEVKWSKTFDEFVTYACRPTLTHFTMSSYSGLVLSTDTLAVLDLRTRKVVWQFRVSDRHKEASLAMIYHWGSEGDVFSIVYYDRPNEVRGSSLLDPKPVRVLGYRVERGQEFHLTTTCS